jgi:hypothetical protein
MRETISAPVPDPSRLVTQHAGPKLNGYPTSTAARATPIQNPAEGLWGEIMIEFPRAIRPSPQNPESAQTVSGKSCTDTWDQV